MTKREDFSPGVQRVADALRELDQCRLALLSERLGIDNELDEAVRWARIGMALARNEPEFSTRKKLGRPPKKAEETKDVRRAKIVVLAAEALSHNPHAQSLTQTEWIKICVEVGVAEGWPDFTRAVTTRALQNSVSRGLRKLGIPPDLFTNK